VHDVLGMRLNKMQAGKLGVLQILQEHFLNLHCICCVCVMYSVFKHVLAGKIICSFLPSEVPVESDDAFAPPKARQLCHRQAALRYANSANSYAMQERHGSLILQSHSQYCMGYDLPC